MEGMQIAHTESGGRGEYRATLPDGTRAGVLTYQRHDDTMIATHTLVPGEMQGRGIAGHLVARLVADARAQGWKIVPQCSYVAMAFGRHPEWADLRA